MTPTMTAAAKSANQPGNCECGGHSECCELECLVQPRFFCGQLLADQDLTALVDWIKNKTGLARFRHGWGVVCGLDVQCGPQGGVTVGPGYAMDCCGRDVVLCKETTFDLRQCWKRPASPCSDESAAQPGQARPTAGRNISFGGFSIPDDQVQVFDLWVRYAESQSDARSALARGGCGGAAGCEYARVHEDYQLYCLPASGCEDPSDQYAAEWYEQYRTDLARKLQELEDLRAIADPRARLQRVIEYLQRFPPVTFCFLREWLCDLLSQSTLPAAWDADLYFWVLQDWRNARFQTPCRGCGPDTGVRLARVWLWMRQASRDKEVFTTLYVNSYSPFRRALTQEIWPARVGTLNLASYIWAQTDAAVGPLQMLGFTIDRRDLSLADLPRLVRQEPLILSVAENRHLTIYQYPDPCHLQRVVCFGRNAESLGRPIPDINELAVDDPKLDLKSVPGIRDVILRRLKSSNIRNVVELAMAKPEDVAAALADLKVNRPDENELIKLARNRLDELTKES